MILESRLPVAVVSYEGLGSSRARSTYVFPFSLSPFFFLENVRFIRWKVAIVARVDAFLNLLHNETSSALELTLFQSIRRCTGELFSSLSRMVRRKSSIASLIAVRTTITIRGTAFKPGFVAPKMLKNYTYRQFLPKAMEKGAHTARIIKNKK